MATTKKTDRRPRTTFTPDMIKQFVLAWMHMDTLAEIAKDMGFDDVNTATSLAIRLRRQGVKLPKKYKRSELDVAGLNELIKKG